MFTVVSTFSGCGGSSLGYQLAGGKVLMAVEIDDNAVQTYKLNFPNTYVHHGDISKLNVDEIFKITKLKKSELDIFDGSPPCQGFSTAGKRSSTDQRNYLFKEYCRLLEGLQPKTFVMENVSGMVKGQMKFIFADILKTLKACGYEVRAALMKCIHYGIPQNRERMIFIGVRNDLNMVPSHPVGKSKVITVREALKGVADYEDRKFPEFLTKATLVMKPLGSTIDNQRIFIKYKGTSGSAMSCRLLDWDKPCPTITKSEIAASGLIHPNRKRWLNLDELKRLHTFPDDFKFTDRKNGCERIGNSVPPLLMKSIASHINETILKAFNG